MYTIAYQSSDNTIPANKVWLARAIAVAADMIQVAAAPLTIEGAFSPVDDGLDLIVGAALTLLVGWHITFIPSFLVKLLPVADLAPTWTMAVLIATRGRSPQAIQDPNAPLPVLDSEVIGPSWGNWYNTLRKPAWTPRPSSISIVWTLLYPLIAVSFGYVFFEVIRQKFPPMVALPFAVNLIANLLFTPILFRMKNLPLALLDILVVLGSLLWAMNTIWPWDHRVAYAQVPYLVWICIATLLQLGITAMNR